MTRNYDPTIHPVDLWERDPAKHQSVFHARCAKYAREVYEEFQTRRESCPTFDIAVAFLNGAKYGRRVTLLAQTKRSRP